MEDHSVVVIGGGSTGCSILYRLTKIGVKDPLLVDMGPQVASGQTSRSTALVRTHYSTEILTRMALSSYRFFKERMRCISIPPPHQEEAPFAQRLDLARA